MAEERTLVLIEDIAFTDRLETEARKLGGGMTGKDSVEQSAMFSFPTKGEAHDFIFAARQQGHRATIQKGLFPGVFTPLDTIRDALLEDAARMRRMLKKPGPKPPWAQ